jgi:hypothetical protein
MDNKLRTSLVAAAVAAVLSNTAFAASDSLPARDALARYDHNVAQAKLLRSQSKINPTRLTVNSATHTQSLNKAIVGNKSADHVDSMLNVTTFSWADDNQKVSNVPFNVLSRKSAVQQSSLHFASKVGSKHGVSVDSLRQAEVAAIHDTGRGAMISKLQQKVNGLEVYQRQLNVVMNQDMELVATTGYFTPVEAPKQPLAKQFKLKAADAISSAFSDMTGDKIDLKAKGEKANYKLFDAEGENYTFSDNPRAKMLYYPGLKKLIPAYYVEIMASEKGTKDLDAYAYVISAEDGKILNRNSLTHKEAFTYKVFADAQAPYTPYDSPMGNAMSPHPTGVFNDRLTETQASMNDVTLENSGISTNDPWLPAGATSTQGNNVDAYADLVAPDGYNEGDIRTQTTSANTFDYQYTHGSNPAGETNINAAVVNLFYTINYLHDLYYDHGFNEAAGTAQMDNYGRGGIEGDPLHAQAQDHSGVNNATMATPLDGSSPRMHMFVWAAGKGTMNLGNLNDVFVNPAGFGAQEYNLTSELVRMNDGDASDGTEFDGCQSAANDVSGKIAFVDRGACAFTQKARNAQAAGAIGIIVANNNPDDPDATLSMGGSDGADITIPAAMVSYSNGQAIMAELDAGRNAITVGAAIEIRDGTVDNAIVEHEWGHYISHRLTGGGMYANSQGAGMGEGWGDFVALMTMVREEDQMLAGNDRWQGVYNDGGYAINNGFIENAYYFGLRRTPYSTNMDVNALTFKHIQDQVALPTTHPISGSSFTRSGGLNAEVHASGEIWAMALWEAYSGILNRDGVSFKDAQSRMMDYMVAGMKITPASPTFTEARDAMLAVAIANDVEDYKVMRAGFTKRGMGINAVSPDRNDPGWDETANSQGHAGVVEDFGSTRNEAALEMVVLDNAYAGANGSYCDLDGTLDVGETSALRFTIRNLGDQSLEGVTATVTSTADVTFGNNGMLTFDSIMHWNGTAKGHIEVTLNSARTNDVIPLTINFSATNPDTRLPAPIETTVEVNRDIVKDATVTVSEFESAPITWADWSQHKIGPANSGNFAGLDDWTVIDVGFDTGNTVMGPDGRVQTDISLMSPMIKVGASGDFAMDFIHYYEFESSPAVADGENIHWDAGVMEISIDGGDWVDVVDAGGKFAVGYNGVINPGGDGFGPNPVLGGRNGFVNFNEALWLSPETLTFPDGVLNGHDVQIRFRIGTDGSVGAWGWNVDNVTFTNATNTLFSSIVDDSAVCVNRPPVVSNNQISATEGQSDPVTLKVDVTDIDGDAVTYHWEQKAGPMVMLSDASAMMPTFMTPMVSKKTTLEFEVTVTDAQGSGKGMVSVEIANAVAPTLTVSAPSVATTYDKLGGEPVTFMLEFAGADMIDLKPEHISLIKTGLVDAKVTVQNGNTKTPTVTVENIGIIGGAGTIAISVAAGAVKDGDGNASNAVTSATFTVEKFYE